MEDFTIHSHESVMGVYVSPHPEPPSHLRPHPIPLGCPSALTLSALFHALSLDWSPILHTVIYMFQCYSQIFILSSLKKRNMVKNNVESSALVHLSNPTKNST